MKLNTALRVFFIVIAAALLIITQPAHGQRTVSLKSKLELMSDNELNQASLSLTEAIFWPSKKNQADSEALLRQLNCTYLKDTFEMLKAYKKYAGNNANAQMKNIIMRDEFVGTELSEGYSLNSTTTVEKYWIDWEANCPDGVHHPNPRSHDGYQRTAVVSGTALENWYAGMKGPAPQAYAKIFKYALQRCKGEKNPLPKEAAHQGATPEEIKDQGKAAYQRALRRAAERAGGRSPNSDSKSKNIKKENQPSEENK